MALIIMHPQEVGLLAFKYTLNAAISRLKSVFTTSANFLSESPFNLTARAQTELCAYISSLGSQTTRKEINSFSEFLYKVLYLAQFLRMLMFLSCAVNQSQVSESSGFMDLKDRQRSKLTYCSCSKTVIAF